MQYTICDVRVSELLTKQVSVPPWEVPVLEAIHGANVKVVGEEEIDRDPPSPEDEYQRLCNKYRGNKEDSNSVVAMVYGPFEAGISKMRDEMRSAGVDVDQQRREQQEARRVPAVRSSRMALGVRDREAMRELDAEAIRTAGTPSRVRLRPTGIAPSNADPKLGQDIGQQSKLARQERQQQAQGQLQPQGLPAQGQLQPQGLRGQQQQSQSRQTPQSMQRRSNLQPSFTGDQGLEQRKQEARQARQRFMQQQANSPAQPAQARSPAPIRPR